MRKRTEAGSRGSMTIEAAISLFAFLFLMLSLMSIIQVCRAQMLIQSALNKSAQEISQYMYLYKLSGLYDLDIGFQEAGEQAEDTADGAVKKLENMSAGIDSLWQGFASNGENLKGEVQSGDYGAALKSLADAAKEGKATADEIGKQYTALAQDLKGVADNPMAFVKSLGALGVSFGMDQAKSFLIGSLLAKSMVLKYLETGDQTADARLRALNVVDGEDGLGFSNSSIFMKNAGSANGKENINLVVVYEMKLFPLLFKGFTVTYAQSASVRAWLGGDGGKVAAPPPSAAPMGGDGP